MPHGAYASLLQDIRTLQKPIMLIGLMGVGKTQTGRKLAEQLDWDFVDSDEEVENTAGCPIREIFDRFGEERFRDIERRVVCKLLDKPGRVVATGGGAFMQPEIRACAQEKALSLWLRANLDTLVERTAKSKHRPLLLQQEPRLVLGQLMDLRYPIYAEADLVVDTDHCNRWQTLENVLNALRLHARTEKDKAS